MTILQPGYYAWQERDEPRYDFMPIEIRFGNVRTVGESKESPLADWQYGHLSPLAAITPTVRWALETLTIWGVPDQIQREGDFLRARQEVAKWLDSLEPRVVDAADDGMAG